MSQDAGGSAEEGLASGALAQVKSLHSLAERTLHLHEDALRKKEHIDDLRSELDRLVSQRAELRLRAALCGVRPVDLASAAGEADPGISQAYLARFRKHHLARRARRRVAEATLAFRLAGLTVSHERAGVVSCWLETSYKGRYHERYALQLVAKPDGTLKVGRHSVPAFIPVRALEQELLASGAERFLSRVGEYAQAHVARREQVRRARTLSFVKIAQTTEACDYVYIGWEAKGERFEGFLRYRDPRRSAPSEARVRRRTTAFPVIDEACLPKEFSMERVAESEREHQAEAALLRERLEDALEELAGTSQR